MAKQSNLDYGVIGNCRSAALVSSRGRIDWCCLADFDSPSVFAALLDRGIGGSFIVDSPHEAATCIQRYLPRTNLLSTRWTDPDGEFEVIDFMPRYIEDESRYHCPPDVIRLVRRINGRPRLRVHFDPKLGYAQHPTRLLAHAKYIKAETVDGAHESVYLYSNLQLDAVTEPQERALQYSAFLWLSYNQKVDTIDFERADLEFERTKVYWLNWCARTVVVTDHVDAVQRSALVLKLLSFQESGAIIAAPTTSLPESLGETRNWDYRYCWIRDASMVIRTLVSLGHEKVARRFFRFLLDVVPYKDERIQIMYGVRGQRQLEERQLDWLTGYEDSRPVRIGNAAWTQQQNDIYGVLLDAIYQGIVLFRGSSAELESLWTMTRGIVRHIEALWRDPDQGIWEIRGEPRHFTHSKLMCWVGLDRAARVARMLHFDDYAELWTQRADAVRADIGLNGWSERRQAFTQSYGSSALDAANLLMWRSGFVDASDPRWVATVRATYAELCVDGLTYRYRNADDFGLPKSAFTVCTFWMIQALYSIGERGLAREMFDKVLGLSNHLGLLSEDMDPETLRLLGNFPQGYSHLALIDTALLFGGQEQR